MRVYRWVLVTGGSRGLGAALARELAARDYGVILTARDEDGLRRVSEPLQDVHGARVQWRRLDLSEPHTFPAFVSELESRHGPLDVLINNAGVGQYRPLTQWTAQDISDCIAVNLTAPLLLTHAVLPGMLARRRGMIVNIASDLSRRFLAQMSPYVATKWGLLGFSGSLLREVKSQGIKVTAILPGIIDTAFNGATEGSKEETWAMRPAMLAARIVDTLELPEHVVVDELTIHPVHQEF